MFDTEIRTGNFRSWLLQQFAAVLLPLLWAIFTSPVEAAHSEAGRNPVAAVLALVWAVVFFWGFGFILGLLVQLAFPRAEIAGKWVWVVPVILLVAAVIHGASESQLPRTLRELFDPTQKGEDAYALFLFTYPTVSSILYSVGVLFSSAAFSRRSAE